MILSEPELQAWGARVGATASPPLFIALRGDLGAGKSTFARAVARGAGVEGPVPSPTFNLLFRYDARVTVVHLDLYRIEDPDEAWELGWADLPAPDEIVLVEWPERAEALLPDDRWEVRFREEGDAREVTATRLGRAGPLPMPGGDR